MLVDMDKLKEAKEKIGDKAADIIAELLEVEKYDSKNKKGCCPFHREDTPSFVWNSKVNSFHCFGCSNNTDIIDAYLHTGMTYLEACEKVFELAHMNYSFAEKGVKTRKEYRYPKDDSIDNKDKVYKYLKLRCISKETVDAFDVGEDKNGNCIFKFKDLNNVLTMVKYRPTHAVEKGNPKTWCQQNSDTCPLLFHMDKINPSEALLIQEGEIDSMAAYESGFRNVVSIPLGCGNLHWIEHNWEWLDQFSNIIICFDNDAPGQEHIKDICYRLGSWRTSVVTIPEIVDGEDGKQHKVKDLNEYLFFCGKEKTYELLMSSKAAEETSVTEFSTIEDVNLDELPGIRTGFIELDKVIGKLYYGSLTLVSGKASAGKSSLINAIIANSMDEGIPTWMFSKEMSGSQVSAWLCATLAGRGNMNEYMSQVGTPYYRVSSETKSKIKKWCKDMLYLYNDDAPNDEDSLLLSMENCVRKYGCKVCILDSLMCVDIKGDSDKFEAQTKFINRLIAFAKKFNVAIILIAHFRKMPAGIDASMDDIAGSSNIINLAHRSLSLRRVGKKEKEDPKNPASKYSVVLTILKDRMNGQNDVEIYFHYDLASRRFFSNLDEYRRNYGWDENKSNKSLGIPECMQDKAEELYGK